MSASPHLPHALLLGTVFLQEQLRHQALPGMGLIAIGLILVNSRQFQSKRRY